MIKTKVTIFGYNDEAEAIVAAAARISTTEGSALDLFESALEKDNSPLISKVVGLGHVTVTEHAVFNIAFDGVSMLFEQFLIEHRLAAYTIKSRRYVDFADKGEYSPTLRMKDGSRANKDLDDKLTNLNDGLSAKYIQLVDMGIPKEDARFILPYSLRSNIIMTVNARELMKIIYTLKDGRGKGYPELKSIGNLLLEQAQHVLPEVFNEFFNVEKGYEDKEKLFDLLMTEAPLNQKVRTNAALVDVVTHTQGADMLLPMLALMSHSGCSPDAALDYLKDNPESQEKALHYLTNDRRMREMEQMSVTYRINSITLASLTHITRHRVQNLIVPSFTEMGKSEDYILPLSIKTTKGAQAIYAQGFKDAAELYNELGEAGVFPEDLAYLYQGGNTTSVITTMNGRELIHFFGLRCCNRAQWEIRGIADLMLGAARRIAPGIFNNVGPTCITRGSCKEGKMSCGRIEEVRSQY